MPTTAGTIEVEVIPDLSRLVGALEELAESFRVIAEEVEALAAKLRVEE